MRGVRVVTSLLGVGCLAAVLAGGGCGSGDGSDQARQGAPGEPPEGRAHWVTPGAGATLRAGPGVDSEALAPLPWGRELLVTGESVGYEEHAGVQGGWAPVWFEGQRGYVFAPFILPFPPPPKDCEGLDHWAKAIGATGAKQVVAATSCTELQIGYDGVCDETSETPLKGGGVLQHNRGWEWGHTKLSLPGVDGSALWAAARRCLTPREFFHGRALPTRAGPFEMPGEDIFEAATVAEDGRVGWEWSSAGSGYVFFLQERGGAAVVEGYYI